MRSCLCFWEIRYFLSSFYGDVMRTRAWFSKKSYVALFLWQSSKIHLIKTVSDVLLVIYFYCSYWWFSHCWFIYENKWTAILYFQMKCNPFLADFFTTESHKVSCVPWGVLTWSFSVCVPSLHKLLSYLKNMLKYRDTSGHRFSFIAEMKDVTDSRHTSEYELNAVCSSVSRELVGSRRL